MFKLMLATFTATAITSTAHAQTAILDYSQSTEQEFARKDYAPKSDEWTGFFAIGSAMLPEYDGAEDYQIIPIAAGQANYGNYYIATRGLGVVANVVDSRHFNAGPIVRYRFGRDNNVENATVARLRELDAAIELGAFMSLITRGLATPGDNLELSLSAVNDVGGGHGGMLGELSANYMIPVQRNLRIGLSADIGYQSANYAEEYFSIDADNAARSGLAQYDADGGLNSAGVGMTTIYSFTRNWGLFGMVQYDRLLADAADSPIVTQEGNPNQLLGIAAITYRF